MDTAMFLARIQREVALPDVIFAPLYGPVIEWMLSITEGPDQPSVLRALLTVSRLRSAEIIPRGIAPEEAFQRADMWTYAVLASGARASAGFLDSEADAKQWIVSTIPSAARDWLHESVVNALLLHCQGRTSASEPILSLIVRGFAREDPALALPRVIDSVFARAERGDITHCRFGSGIYFPAGCCVITRERFDQLSFGAFSSLSDEAMLEQLTRCSTTASLIRFSLPTDTQRGLTGFRIERASRLPPYPDLVVDALLAR